MLVYHSAWLKCYHPAAFYTALLNNQPMGFWSPAVIVNDVRRALDELRRAYDESQDEEEKRGLKQRGQRVYELIQEMEAAQLRLPGFE